MAISQMGSLYNYAYWMTESAEDSSELVSHAYGEANLSRRGDLEEEDVRFLLFQTLRRLIIQHRERAGGQKGREQESEFKAAFPDREDRTGESEEVGQDSISSALEAIVRHSIRSMPEEYGSAILLRDLGDLHYAEIARIMKCSAREVAERIHQGQKMLRDELARYVRMLVQVAQHMPVRSDFAFS
ncbi:MAG: RNA polymerase sigma factor [Ignavibacteria bacterium]|nr:MAG: RNA polymerase sigma factor [Ignavibacteria bacterium]